MPHHRKATLPEVHATTLNGKVYSLPKDLSDAPSLVFVVFLPSQQKQVEEWLPHIRTVHKAGRPLPVLELLLNAPYDDFYQDFINEGWINAIPQPALQDCALSLFMDKQGFRSQLGVPHEDGVFLFLVNRVGQVLWRHEGGWSPQSQGALERALSHLGARRQSYFAA